jgi:hypothetical protein
VDDDMMDPAPAPEPIRAGDRTGGGVPDTGDGG